MINRYIDQNTRVIIDPSKGDKFLSRIALLDNVRGLIILIYIITQTAILYSSFLPMWLRHDAGASGIFNTNLGFMDLGPSLFYFIIGLTAVMAFNRRKERLGLRAAYTDFFYRNMTLIAFDAIVTFFINKYMYPADWNIIRSIGFTGLLMIPFINSGTKARAAAGLIIIVFYQCFHDRIFALMDGHEGGIAACFGFLTVVLFSSVLKDLYDKGLLYYLLGLIAVFIMGLISYAFVPIVYREFNSTYLLLTLSLYGAIFFLFALFDRYVISRPIPVISWMGQSLIMFFVIGAGAQLFITRIYPPIDISNLIYAEIFMISLAALIATILRWKRIIVKV